MKRTVVFVVLAMLCWMPIRGDNTNATFANDTVLKDSGAVEIEKIQAQVAELEEKLRVANEEANVLKLKVSELGMEVVRLKTLCRQAKIDPNKKPLSALRIAKMEEAKSRTSTRRQITAIGYTLAVIDNAWVGKDDVIVRRYQYLSEQLAKRFNTTTTDIGDIAVASINILRDEFGKTVKILSLLEAANEASVMQYKVNMSLEVFFAALTVLIGAER